TVWDVTRDTFGALPFIYGTLVTSAVALFLALPVSIGLALFLTEMSPASLKSVVSFPIALLAGIPSVVYGLWGLFILVPVLRRPIEPALQKPPPALPGSRDRPRIPGGRDGAGDHDPPDHHLHRHRGAPDRARGAARGGACAGGDPVGGDPDHRAALRPRRHRGRDHARPGSRPGRDHGGDDVDRKFAHHPGLALRTRVLGAGGDRERVRRGERRAASLRAGGPGPDPLCGHRGAQHRGAPSGAHVAARSGAGSRMKSIVRRRAVNWVMTGLCALA